MAGNASDRMFGSRLIVNRTPRSRKCLSATSARAGFASTNTARSADWSIAVTARFEVAVPAFVLPERRVTLHSGDIGNTSALCGSAKCLGWSVPRWMSVCVSLRGYSTARRWRHCAASSISRARPGPSWGAPKIGEAQAHAQRRSDSSHQYRSRGALPSRPGQPRPQTPRPRARHDAVQAAATERTVASAGFFNAKTLS
jgi:hypothetical protein